MTRTLMVVKTHTQASDLERYIESRGETKAWGRRRREKKEKRESEEETGRE